MYKAFEEAMNDYIECIQSTKQIMINSCPSCKKQTIALMCRDCNYAVTEPIEIGYIE